MKATHALPSRYALILDPVAIRKVLRKVESLDLPRRECHPLERYTGKKVSSDLARYDAAIERGFIDEGPSPIEDIIDAHRGCSAAEDDDQDDDWDA